MASVKAEQMTRVEGPLSNMGRLDCKDASLIAFSSLRQDADIFMTISDNEAIAAVATRAKYGIDTTPSGAASLAALKNLEPGANSRCLVIATEGPEGD